MNIGINVSFLRKPGTGIGQVTVHFLATLLDRVNKDEDLQKHRFFLYAEEKCDLTLPQNFVMRTFVPWYTRDDLFRKLLWEKYCLPRCARKDKCDVLISMYQSSTMIKYTDMRHIMVVHDIIPEIFPEYVDNMRKKHYWKQVRKGIYSAQAIVAVSEHTRADLQTRLNVKAARVAVAPIAVDPIFLHSVTDNDRERVKQKYGIKEGGYIYASGLEMRKNIDRTLRAYKILREKMTNVPPLVISGKLMPELSPLIVDVERMAQDLGIAAHVRAVGFVAQEDLPALYDQAVMFVFPTLYEGFGMPVLEAMSIGTPVITSPDTSIPEVGGNTVIYAVHDDHALCDAMEEVLLREEMRMQLSQRARARAKDFTWDRFFECIKGIGSF